MCINAAYMIVYIIYTMLIYIIIYIHVYLNVIEGADVSIANCSTGGSGPVHRDQVLVGDAVVTCK